MTRLNGMPGRWHRVAASVILAAGFVSAFPAAAHAAPATVVTIQFDDGNADVNQWSSALSNHGFQPESFAYPFVSSISTVETQVIQYCGDNSGRGVAGVNDRTVFAETIPPADPYAT